MTDAKEAEKELMFAYQYYHDIRTGFPNELFRVYEQGALTFINYWQSRLKQMNN